MARSTATQLAQPIFHEPVFGEDISTADPTGFLTRHGSDRELFREIGNLSKKDVVAIRQSRAADDAQFTLAEAYGGHDPAVTKAITGAESILFHALGDSGASNAGKYPNELRVADQVTLDCVSSK